MANSALPSLHVYRDYKGECAMCGRRSEVHVSRINGGSGTQYQEPVCALPQLLQENGSEGAFSVTPPPKRGRPKLTPEQRKESAKRAREKARLRQQRARRGQ